jgi:hypothetical protein
MSGSGAGHIQKMPLEVGELVGQIWVRDLVAGKSCLTGHVWSKGRTYAAKLTGFRSKGLDKSCGLGNLEVPDMSGKGAGHVRQMPLEFSDFGWTSLGFSGKLVHKKVFDDLNFTNSPNGTYLLGLK